MTTNQNSSRPLNEYLAWVETQKEEISSDYELLAKQHAPNGSFPRTREQYYGAVVKPLQNTIQECIDRNHTQFLPVSELGIAQMAETRAIEKKTRLTAQANDLQKQLKALNRQLKIYLPNLSLRRLKKIILIALIIVAACEGYFAFTAMRIVTPLDTAVFTGLLVAFGTGMAAHHLGHWIKRSISVPQYKRRYIFSLAIAALAFSGLAYLRAKGFNQVPAYMNAIGINNDSSSEVSAFPIGLISFTIYWLCLFLSIKFSKTEAEREQEEKYDQICKEKASVSADYNSCIEEVAQIDKQLDEEKRGAAKNYETAVSIECGLITFAYSVLSTYNNTNFNFRPARDYPEFFASTPEMTFKTFFDNIKRKIHEKQ